MQALIQDLLAYSRVNTTRQELARTDTADVLAAVERHLDVQLREAGAVITHDPMPVVLADPLQLEQVFANLVSNAIKFRRPDEPLRVHVGARRLGRLLGVLGRRQRDRDRARVLRPDLRDLPAAPHEGDVPGHRASASRS
jgi:light-regulated signal transduction histidine kinase (bacteriophytochrome)